MRTLLLITLTALASLTARADQIEVTFKVTPEFNDFLLNFSVTNNIGVGVEIWSFGVNISSGQDIPSFGVPLGWADAGPGVPYNNNWTTDPVGPNTILFGEMLSGFIARDNDSVAPLRSAFFTLAVPVQLTIGPGTIDWIALTIDDTGKSRSMTGTASSVAPVPEPSGLMLLCAGLAMLGLARLRTPPVAFFHGKNRPVYSQLTGVPLSRSSTQHVDAPIPLILSVSTLCRWRSISL
ncbi:MAG: PEP-CTERM sorting domain-containing protein [Candidatus Solibacter usitatus]|nr:PEP-CTERM sorting domain-containing protein [Candidatus Solibacter usitatus]